MHYSGNSIAASLLAYKRSPPPALGPDIDAFDNGIAVGHEIPDIFEGGFEQSLHDGAPAPQEQRAAAKRGYILVVCETVTTIS
jgi:hypothetical protein